MEKTSSGLQENLAGALCYLFGWVTGLIFFLVEPKNKFVRFHAVQSIALTVVLMVVYFILFLIPIIGWAISAILGIAFFILWILLMLKAYQGQLFKLPLVGNFAEQQANKVAGA
jgi:uncharacterized membrane protein